MRFFSRRPNPAVPASIVDSLAEYGQAVLASRSGPPLDPRFGWDYVGPVVTAMNGPQREQVIQELYDAADAAPSQPLVTVGAYNLLYESNTASGDERFIRLRDTVIEYMREQRYSSGHLTRDEADRWIELHGDLRSSFDNIVDVEVPTGADAPPAKDLAVGESRLVALTAPLPEGNAFFAEHRSSGDYIVYSERPKSSDDPTRARYDEDYLGTFSTITDLLRGVGQMFGTRPYWAEEDLEPYFPSRRV